VNFIKNFNETYTILSRLDIERNKSNDLISQKYLNIFYYMPDIYTCLGPKSYPFYTNFYIKIVNDFCINKSKTLENNIEEIYNIESNFDGETLKLIDDIINCFNYETDFEVHNINYKFLNDVNNYRLYVFYMYLEIALLKILVFTKYKNDEEMNKKLFEIFYLYVTNPNESISRFNIKNLCNEKKNGIIQINFRIYAQI
jgi:hypothetical protein